MSSPQVNYQSPAELFEPTGPWSILAEAGPLVFLAGLRGLDPATSRLLDDPLERTRQIFINMQLAARSVGLDLHAVMRLTFFVTDMKAHRPLVNQVQREFWGDGPYPPRTIVEVSALNQDDFVEVEATLYRPV